MSNFDIKHQALGEEILQKWTKAFTVFPQLQVFNIFAFKPCHENVLQALGEE